MAYQIKQGDTLGAIAQANKTDVASLLKLNPTITNPNLIQAGASLNIPTAIPATAIGNTQPVPTPTATTDTTNYSAVTSSLVPPPAPVADTTYTDKSKALLDSILNENNDLTGKTAYEQQQLDASGATALTKRQTELASQLTALNNETAAKKLALGDQPILSSIAAGQMNAEALTINSEYALNAGNLDTAKQNAQRAVDLKYKDTEDAIDRNTKLLQLYTPFMNAEQTKLAEQRQVENDAKKQDLSDKKKIQGDIISAAQTNNQADIASQALKLDPNSSTFLSDLSALQAKLSNPDASIDTQIKKAQLAQINANIIKTNAETKGLSIPPITNPEAGQYSTALSVILGSGKFTKAQTAQITNAINSGQDPFTVIKNQAKSLLGQTESTNLTKIEVARDTLSDIGNQLAQYYAAGGKTNLISGTLSNVANKLGTVTDPKLAGLATQIKANIQVYRNAISGTAYSEQEGKDINSIFPGINNGQTLNDTILRARDTVFNSVIDATYRAALGSTYDELKKSKNVSSQPDIMVLNGKNYKKQPDGTYLPE